MAIEIVDLPIENGGSIHTQGILSTFWEGIWGLSGLCGDSGPNPASLKV